MHMTHQQKQFYHLITSYNLISKDNPTNKTKRTRHY
uniref:Uncharacterized protein n=1 Tax=Arundo donax TaxID=35708 RepID=A0A0A8YAI0_ARUDO